MLALELAERLNQLKITYALVGGYALAFYGIVRATVDVDLVVSLDLKSLEAVEKLLIEEFKLQSRIPVRAQEIFQFREEYIKNRNLIAWSFVDPASPIRQVDILINYDVKDLVVNRIKVGAVRVSVASVESLYEMKLVSNRPQDQLDIEKLKEKINEKKK